MDNTQYTETIGRNEGNIWFDLLLFCMPTCQTPTFKRQGEGSINVCKARLSKCILSNIVVDHEHFNSSPPSSNLACPPRTRYTWYDKENSPTSSWRRKGVGVQELDNCMNHSCDTRRTSPVHRGVGSNKRWGGGHRLPGAFLDIEKGT